jgi:hypothetical protein
MNILPSLPTARRLMLGLPLAITALCALILTMPASASPLNTQRQASIVNPKPKAPIAVEILSPAPQALLLEGPIGVKLRTGPRVTGVHAWIGTTDVSKRFKRNGRSWTAAIPRTGLASGPNRLLVEAQVGTGRGATARVAFTLGKRSPGLIRTLTAPSLHAALRNGPGSLQHYVPKQGTALVAIRTARPMHAELRINGRLVPDPTRSLLMREHRWNASANDGVKAGVNRIDVRAFDAAGRYDRKTWTMTRPRALPLVEAGAPITTGQGRWTKLSARGSLPSPTAKGLTYAWRVVVKPKGSSPVLRNATGPTPQLKTNVRGYYEVALTVRDKTARGKNGRKNLLGATPSLGAEDAVAVTVGPTLTEQGLYVDTTLAAPTSQAPNGTLTVNGSQYPLSAGANGSVAVQLDPTTLQVVASGPETTVNPTDNTITIVALDGTGGQGSITTQVFLGIDLAATNGWLYNDISNPAGYAVKGWLRPATATSPPTWVGGGDALTFTTRAQGSAANTTIFDIEGQQFTATLAAGSSTGFAALALTPNGSPSMPLPVFSFPGPSDPSGNVAAITALRGWLENAGQNNWVIMLQSIGPIQPPDSSPATLAAWAGLGSTIATFGGNADVFGLLDGSQDAGGGSYALVSKPFVGLPVVPPVTIEASQERTHSGGSISGLLMRAPLDGMYEPVVTDSSLPDSSGAHYDFLPFLYGPPTDWSNWMRDSKTDTLRAPTSGENAALASIVNSAILNTWVPATPMCQGAPDAIRGYYCDIEATDLTSLATRISTLQFDASNANGFTSTDFSNVRTSLVEEVTDVANIRAGIAEYQALFGTESQTGSVDAGTIAQTIQSELDRRTNASVTGDMWGMMTTTLTLMSADTDIDDLVTFVGGLFMLESQELPNPTPSLPNQVELTQATAAAELTTDYNQASINLDTYGDYLVQDPVKLLQGAQMLSTGRYAVTSNDKADLLAYADYGAKQWLWGTTLGTSFTVWTAPAQTYSRNITCLYGTAIVNPFANVADSGYWGPPEHLGGDQWWIGVDYSSDPTTYVLRNNAGLGQSVTDPLFSPIDPTKTPATQVNVGAAMPYFALTYLGSKPMMLSKGAGTNGCFS